MNTDLRSIGRVDRKLRECMRLRWLKEHPKLWMGYPPAAQPSSHDREPRKREIVDGLKAAGLISEKTYTEDVNVSKMVQRLREKLAKGEI